MVISAAVQTPLVRTSHMAPPIVKKAGNCSLYVQENEMFGEILLDNI